MKTTRLSTKGQVIIPRALCKAHRWEPGTEFAVEETDEGLLLKPLKPFGATRIEEVIGCAGYTGPRRSLRDMARAIAQGGRQRSS